MKKNISLRFIRIRTTIVLIVSFLIIMHLYMYSFTIRGKKQN